MLVVKRLAHLLKRTKKNLFKFIKEKWKKVNELQRKKKVENLLKIRPLLRVYKSKTFDEKNHNLEKIPP